MDVLPLACERARVSASLRADGELSELESAQLEAHLRRCAACRGFTHGFALVAGALRSTHLVPPARGVVRRRRRSSGA